MPTPSPSTTPLVLSDPDLMLCRDAARMMGCGAAWVRYLVDVGRLPALRTASGVRVLRRADVEAYLKKKERDHAKTSRSS